ncbi:MAG: MBL fold metallo-hydrolase [Halioglobus sp.]
MVETIYEELGQGISCIDANYGAFGRACFYLLEHAGECAVIETGTANSVENLLRCMADKSLEPNQVKYVIPTHVHLDHAGGAGLMMQTFAQASLVVHPKGARHLIDPSRLVASSIAVYGEETFQRLYGEVVPVAPHRVIEAEDNGVLDLGGRPLRLRFTPGHADHHFCVWDQHSRGWFSGDMFGLSYPEMRFETGNFVMASTTPNQFRPEAFIESVALLRSYSPERMYLTHYGELAYRDELAELLCQQVTDYQSFAPLYEGRIEALAKHIADYTLARLSSLGPPEGVEACRSVVEGDANLNAQGLAVWLDRMNISPQLT